jgi:HSP20 family molecular chaperone IbpA
MSKNKSFDHSKFDWEQFNSQIEGIAGANKFLGKNKEVDLELSWLEEYLQGILGNALPDYVPAKSKAKQFHYEIFETLDYVIVRVILPSEHKKNLRLLMDTNALLLSGEGEKTQKITLPCNGRYSGSTAVVKDNVLEIKIIKSNENSFKQLDINYL